MLSDHFDFFAGTSTGAIIATCLSWGMDVESVMEMYVENGKKMFQRFPWYRPFKRMFVARYQAQPISDMLQRIFSEDGEGKVPALLSTETPENTFAYRAAQSDDRIRLAGHK